MSHATDAFEAALNARAEATGKREKVLFQGKLLTALIGSQTEDYSPGAGGLTSGATLRVSVRTHQVTFPIAQTAPIEVRGKQLAVLRHDPLEGRVDLFVGDPSSELT